MNPRTTVLTALIVLVTAFFAGWLITHPISVAEVVTQAKWNTLSASEQARFCDLYRQDPVAMEAAFKRDGSPAVDESWVYLTQILRTDCTHTSAAPVR